MCFEYFLKPQLSPSASGLMGFILGEQAALNPSLNPSKASPDALNQALGLNSKILLATMKGAEIIRQLVQGERTKQKAVEMAAITVGSRYSVAALGEQLDQILNSEKVENSGDIASTLILALYCFGKSKSFNSCIHIVRQDIAGEKKLISAVAGSFAGVYYKLYGRPIQDVSRYETVINGFD